MTSRPAPLPVPGTSNMPVPGTSNASVPGTSNTRVPGSALAVSYTHLTLPTTPYV